MRTCSVDDGCDQEVDGNKKIAMLDGVCLDGYTGVGL